MDATEGSNGFPGRFKQALQKTESTRSAEHVATLFAGGARLTNLGGDHGQDAQTFWQIYLEQFRDIRSEFTGETVSNSSAALEWVSRGTLADGRPVEYRGISVIDFDREAVTAFRTYYDSAAFVRSKS
ncbi:MAG: nuclear transport factor 2 family protein [Verrucomicrobiota bacterium]|nr:nuclear transport factor 2 family protein [Verrucomicrobiota bacterium]